MPNPLYHKYPLFIQFTDVEELVGKSVVVQLEHTPYNLVRPVQAPGREAGGLEWISD